MPLVSIRPQDLITGDDVPPAEVPEKYWTFANNVGFRDGFAERVNGWESIYGDALDTPLHVRNSFFEGSNYWIYGTANGIFVTTADGTHYDITPATDPPVDTTVNDWTSCELNGIPILNYRNGPPVYWERDVGTACQPLPGWTGNGTVGGACNVVRAFKNYIIALGFSQVGLPDVVAWSDAAEPGAVPQFWRPFLSTDAGSFALGGTPEAIVDGVTVRDQFLVLKSHSTHLMQYVGGNFIFGQREFLSSTGALSANCAVEARGSAVIFADGDVLITDGNTVDSLVDRRVRRKLAASLSQDNYKASYVCHNTNRNEVWICFPTAGATYANTALVFDLESGRERTTNQALTGGLSFRDIYNDGNGCPYAVQGNVSEVFSINTWDTQGYFWDTPEADVLWNATQVQAANDGLIGIKTGTPGLVLMDSRRDKGEGNLAVSLRRDSLDFGDASMVKLCNEIWPRFTGSPGDSINVRVGTQMFPDDEIEWLPYQAYVIGQDRKLDVLAQGRYLSFQFTSTGGDVWNLPGFDVNLIPSGKF
jgi:hypothetical protein